MAKERTPEEKATRKAASQAKRKNKRNSLVLILDFVKSRKNVPDEVQAAVRLLTPGQRVGGGGGPKKLDVYADLFTARDQVSEMEIFQSFKAGRAEMRKICVSLIKKRKPEDRIWVQLDSAAEVYVVQGIGANSPNGWTGYTPVEVEDTEII